MSLKEYESAGGAPIIDDSSAETAAPAVTFDHLALDLIVTSRTNPRTSFDAAKLQELVASVAASGVHQPILVRPLPADRLADTAFATDASQLLLNDWPHRDKNSRHTRPAYEIIAGERRYRASILAGKRDIPAMIRQLDDQQVLEAQLVENLQRDDLHPMEEAEGYRRLCEATGIRKEDIGAKIGKSRSYVYQRLHLLELGQEGREAFRTGKFDASKALLLAGVADPKLQIKALKELTTEGYGGATMTVREFRDWLQQNVMLKLDHAPFDIKDMFLAPDAGACGDCPKRTGVNRDIFAAFDSPDMCTDAKCYGLKATVSLQQIKDAAAEKGMKVIAGVEAKKLKPHSWGDEIKGYTRLDEKMEGGTVSKLLGKDAPTPLLFVDPHTHKQIKVLPTDTVGELLKDKGIKVAKAQTNDHAAQRAKDEAKRKARVEYEATWRARAASEIDGKVRAGALTSFSASILRRLCALLFSGMDSDDTDPLLPLWGLPASKADDWLGRQENRECLERHIQAAPDVDLGRMVLTLLMVDELVVHPYQADAATPSMDVLAAEVGIDLAAIQREVKAERKAAAPAKAKPAKTSGATLLAAQAEGESEGSKPAAAGGKKARGKAAKLSAEDAISGIADAMQGVGPTSGVLSLGQRVRFKQDLKSGGGKLRKVSGREGTVESLIGDRACLVRFGEKAHEVATADYTELEILGNAGDLAGLEGMTPELVMLLGQEGVITLDDLANCTVDELAQLSGWPADTAKALITKAREQWFSNGEKVPA
jgi:transcription termination factor NusA